MITSNRIYSLASSAASVIVFNLLFTEPRFTLLAHGKGYPVTFIVMFLAAFISGTLANRLKRSAEQSAQMAYRMKILFDTNQLLSGARDRDEVVGGAARQLKKLLNRDVVFLSYAGKRFFRRRYRTAGASFLRFTRIPAPNGTGRRMKGLWPPG